MTDNRVYVNPDRAKARTTTATPQLNTPLEPLDLAGRTVQELEDMAEHLKMEHRNIRVQLTDMNRCDSKGQRLSSDEYHRWRTGAIRAMTYKENQLGQIRLALKRLNNKLRSTTVTTLDTPDQMIQAAFQVLNGLVEEGTEFTDYERAIIRTLEAYVTKNVKG